MINAQAKQEVKDKIDKDYRDRLAASKLQKAKEKECKRTHPKGHFYKLSRRYSTFPNTYECVGCGKTYCDFRPPYNSINEYID